jgi:hypothetical protein
MLYFKLAWLAGASEFPIQGVSIMTYFYLVTVRPYLTHLLTK